MHTLTMTAPDQTTVTITAFSHTPLRYATLFWSEKYSEWQVINLHPTKADALRFYANRADRHIVAVGYDDERND